MFKRILVPVDGSETSTKALVAALQLARESGGRVRVMHALDELAFVSGYGYAPELMQVARDHGARILQDAMDIARSSGVPADSRLVDVPGRRLGDLVAEEAQSWEADLVVAGTHGRRGIGGVLLGSGAEQVVRMAPTPVLTIRGGEARPV